MTHVTHSLPRQPIPPLDDTLHACVRSVSPALNSLQRLKSKIVFELYGAAQAKQQQRLLALAQQHPINWCAAGLTRLWLSCRGGLPYSNNYVLMLEDDAAATSLTARAARLTVAAVHLYQRIRAQALSPDVVANLPLAMDQYRRCYATHRRPQLGCDEIVSVNGSHHIAVLIDGDVHCMAIDLQRGTPTVSAVQQAYDHIVESGEATLNDVAPSMLTALPREQWARRRGELQKNEQNAQTLALLEKALFVVCLDTGATPGSMSGLSAHLRDGNSHNRYYDKSMQIVVTHNGKAGLCFERAAVDGSVALGYAARLHHVSLRLPAQREAAATVLIRTRASAWAITPALKQHMQAAKKFINEARAQRGVETWTAPQLGARGCKALGISADAVVQLAIQCATSEVMGEMPTIFEPVQTRYFAGGRMDFMMPATAESLAAVRALRESDGNPYSTAAHVRRAAKAHREQIERARSGRGLIAHLLALNALHAEDTGRKGADVNPWRHRVLPYLDKGMKTLLHQDVLAANGSGHAGVASFSPIGPRPHMLSIGYVIKENDITFDLRADGRFSTHTRALRAALDRALANMHKVLITARHGELSNR